MTFACQFGRYRYKWLPFGATLGCNMFQRKINEIFKELPNVFRIADDIQVAGYDDDDDNDRDHDNTVQWVLIKCRIVNLKINKDKCHFRCSSVPFFGKIISRCGVRPDPRKLKALTVTVAICWKKCIWSRTRCWFTTNKRRYKLSKKEIKHLITVSWDQLLSQVRACQPQEKDSVT